MGCFFRCFRMRDKKRQRSVHMAATATPPRCREHGVVKNRTPVGRFHNHPSEIQAPTSQLFEVLSDRKDPRKAENLHRRNGANVKWAQQLVALAEVPPVQKSKDSPERVEEAHKRPISTETRSPFEEVDELALELSELARQLEEGVEDVRKFETEVKCLRSCGTLAQTPIETPKSSETQMVTISEQSLQSVEKCSLKRVVSYKQFLSMSSGESTVSEAQYSIPEVTKPTGIEVKVSDKENLPSKPLQNVADSSSLSLRDDEKGSSCRSVSRTVKFDLAMESPSASSGSVNTGDGRSSYYSTSHPSVSQSSYTVEEEESVASQKTQSYSCSYTESEPHSADLGSEDDSISRSGSSSIITENEEEDERLGSNESKTKAPVVQRQSRYQYYESSDEEEYDSLSDTEESFASLDSETRDENQSVQQFESLAQANRSPPLQKSNYSPQPSPLKVAGDKQSTWTGCPKALENAAVNNNARIRAQYVYPVLNPVENLSQWKALKKDSKTDDFASSEEFYEKNKSWSDYMDMAGNRSMVDVYLKSSPTKKQKVGTTGMVPHGVSPRDLHSYFIPGSGSATKENSHLTAVVEEKKSKECSTINEQSNQGRKLIPFSAEPVFKEPKVPVSQNRPNLDAVPGEQQPSDAVYVDTSLSHWLKPGETVESRERPVSPKGSKAILAKAGHSTLRPNVLESEVNKCWISLQTQNTQVATSQKSSPSRSPLSPDVDSSPISGASWIQNSTDMAEKQKSPLASPSRKNHDDRPILGALPIHNIQAGGGSQVSSRRSPSSRSPDDRPILGALPIQNIQAGVGSQVSPRRSPSNRSPDDRPILGTVAAHWNNDSQPVSPSKWEDGKGGIPNLTNKYKEDQKVSWHTTPFEVRLERALSNGGVEYQRHATDISS